MTKKRFSDLEGLRASGYGDAADEIERLRQLNLEWRNDHARLASMLNGVRPVEPAAPHIHNFKGPDGNMVCECGARMVSKEIAESLAESTDEQAFSPTVRAAELWIDLVKDISATPCKCPDLRDSLVDWVRKQYRVEPEVSAARTDEPRVAHDPKCKPDFPFYLCSVCYPDM